MSRLARVLAGLALLAGCHAAAACDDPDPLRFSLIPRTDPVRQLAEHRPLLRHLERSLGRRVVAVQPSSYGSVIEGLLGHGIDLASMGPASYAIARNRDPSITPFATWTMQGGRYVREGAHYYHSLLIVRRDGGIHSLADLRGARVSLTDPASTSGAVLPRTEFGRRIGRRIEDFFGDVTYSGSHDRSIAGLRQGYVDAAFVASEHLDQAVRDGRIDAEAIRVLWQSGPIPHDPFVYRGRLCPELQARIRQAFLADSPDMAAMLHNLKARRFLPVGDEAYRDLRAVLSQP